MDWEQPHFSRADRVGDQLQQELAIIIQREMKDPRVRFMTISGVRVSKDLMYADVYFTLMSDSSSESVQAVQRVLKKASGFLRSAVAKRMKLRAVPSLRFHYDDTTIKGRTLSDLIDQAVSQDRRGDEES